MIRLVTLFFIAFLLNDCFPEQQPFDYKQDRFWEYDELYGDIREINERILVNGILDSSSLTVKRFSQAKEEKIIQEADFEGRIIHTEHVIFRGCGEKPECHLTARIFSGLLKHPDSLIYEKYGYKELYEYDGLGNITSMTRIEACDTIVEALVYDYDPQMNLTKITTERTTSFCEERLRYGAINHHKSYLNSTFHYNASGLLYEKRTMIGDSYSDHYSIFRLEYDSNDNLIKIIHLENVSGHTRTNKIIHFKKGKQVMITEYYRNGEYDYSIEEKYKFDRYNNWIKKKSRTINTDEPVNLFTVIRDIEYY